MNRDRAAAAVLVSFLCAALLAYGAGFLTSLKAWRPSSTIIAAIGDFENLIVNWRNDFGFEPTRLLVPADEPERRRVTAVDFGHAPGHRLISGLAPGKESNIGILLLDDSGQEIHFWPIRYAELSRSDRNPNTVFLHGVEPLPDGSVVVNFDEGDTIARIGPCGNVLWATAGNFHHGIHRSYDGTLWAWENVPFAAEKGNVYPEFIVQLDPGTGRRLRRISLLDDIIAKHDLFGRFAIHSDEARSTIAWCCDPFHPNDIDVLDPETAEAFPMWRAGDLMISLRSLNMVAVLDPESARVKWSRIGPWHRQHDPDFLPDGTISVLNNNMGVGPSQIMTIDPRTDAVDIVFDGGREGDFYTWRRGRHQVLPNGNIMIAETERGRAVEVDRRGDVVWRYENIYDRNRNGLVNEALVLPSDFFHEGVFEECRGAAR